MTASFPATRWSIITAARSGDTPAAARTALEDLCRLYWFPLYSFARRKGLSPEDAEDATQTFFLDILESNLIAAADPSKGRMRTFLLKAFSDKLVDLHRRAGRLKRGGGVEFVPLDLSGAEHRYESNAALDFDASWASALIEATVRKLEATFASSGRSAIFDALLPFLGTSTGYPPDQTLVASQLGMSHAALRQSLARFRERFRTTLRSTIADTLIDPTDEEIDGELRALASVLSATAQ